MEYDFSDCLVLNCVMAARALTRRYDKVLKRFEVSVVQFTVLMSVQRNKGQPVSHMAHGIAMDRTTMLRNLDLLVKRGLVQAVVPENGYGREFLLTKEGEQLLEDIMPYWHAAQEEIRGLLAGSDPDLMLENLRLLRDG